ncbi:hypothetical protein Tco_1376543 [Tanacetum coccineum]
MEILPVSTLNNITVANLCDPIWIKLMSTGYRFGPVYELMTQLFSKLEEENLREDNDVAEIFKIEMDIFIFKTSPCKEFKEFNHLFHIDVDLEEYWWGKKEKEESSEDAWRNYLPNDEWEHSNQEWFVDHEPIDDDDDDIENLDDYLIPKDTPYYVDEEEITPDYVDEEERRISKKGICNHITWDIV